MPASLEHPGTAVLLAFLEVSVPASEVATISLAILAESAAPVSPVSAVCPISPVSAVIAASFVAAVVASSRFKSLEPFRPVSEATAAALSEGLSSFLSFAVKSGAVSPACVSGWFWAGVLDPHHLAAESLAVEGGDGLLCFSQGGHLHEAEHSAVVERLEQEVGH